MKSKTVKGKVREGYFSLVQNKNPHWSANKFYLQGCIEWDQVKEEAIQLFTDYELEVARKRAERRSDLIPKGSRIFGTKTRFGHITYVKNKKKKFVRENDGYYFVKMHHYCDPDAWYCFTSNALIRSLKRTVRNKEDVVAKTLLTNLFD